MPVLNRIKLATIRLSLLTTVMYMSSISYADDSVYKDPSTNLVWMRCSIGQTWTGRDCTGRAMKLNWHDANDYLSTFNRNGFAGKNNWRLPTARELLTLRRCSKGFEHLLQETGHVIKDMGVITRSFPNVGLIDIPMSCAFGSSRPSLDKDIFPNTDWSFYWSSTTTDSSAMAINFYGGMIGGGGLSGDNPKHDYYVMRLVRSNQ